MKTINKIDAEMDLHRLELRYAETRLNSTTNLQRLTHSIEQHGQVVPVTVVDDGQQVVLIDGYLRVMALQRCGHDMAQVSRWECSVEHALLATLAHEQARGWEALEEANILHILCANGFSQREIALHIGRNVSWVNRRLQLLEGMSDDILNAIRCGKLSTWSATRILIPLARANSEHAKMLLEGLKKDPISSRVLNKLFKHYKKSNKKTRERLVRNPQLFNKAMRTQCNVKNAKQLGEGPEGQWAKTLSIIEQQLTHLIQQSPLLFANTLDSAQHDTLLAPYRRVQYLWQQLKKILPIDTHQFIIEGDNSDTCGQRTNHSQTSPTKNSDTRNLSDIECLPQHSTPHYTPSTAPIRTPVNS